MEISNYAALKERLRKSETMDYHKITTSSSVYQDPDFTCSKEKLVDEESSVKWLSASEIDKDYDVIAQGIEINDMVQGVIGDAYLIAPLAALAEYPYRVEKLLLTKEKNVSGCYAIKLYVAGIPRTIVVDSFFPVNEKGELIYAAAKREQIYPCLIEKAWAKVHGGYRQIEGGEPREAFNALTGATTEFYTHSKIDKKVLWEAIRLADRQKYIICAGGALEKLGLLPNHPYSVIKVCEVEVGKGVFERLVQLRNPQGANEWVGDWSDKSLRWNDAFRKLLAHAPGEDGTFFMKFDDYCSYKKIIIVKK